MRRRKPTGRMSSALRPSAIATGITALVGEAITNPILCTVDSSDFKTVDDYDLANLFKAISDGA